jgi:autotransporter beta-domain protein
LYGATNLNIPRNQEPDALTINPANVHEPYKPSDVIKLETISPINEPSYNLSITAPAIVTTYVEPTNNPSVKKTVNGLTPNDKYVRSTWNGSDATIQTANGVVTYADRDTYDSHVGTTTLVNNPYTSITGTFTNGIATSGYPYFVNSTTNGQNSRGSNHYTLATLGNSTIKDVTPDRFFATYIATLGTGPTAISISGVDAHYSDWDSGAGNVLGDYVTAWNHEYNYYLTTHTSGTAAQATAYANGRVTLKQLTQVGPVYLEVPKDSSNNPITSATYNDTIRTDTSRRASVLVENAGVTVGPSTFDVANAGGNWHSGLEIDLNASGTTTVNNTTFNVYNSSIGLAIDPDDTNNQIVTFTDNPGFYLKGSNGIGINVQNGVDTNGKVEISGNHDMHIGEKYSGVNNVAYNVTNHVKELNITNGNNSVAAGGLTNGTGLIHLEGSNSIAFSDRGYVEGGTVDLKNVHSSNHNNILGYFASFSDKTTNSGAHEPRVKGTNSAIGWFDGTFKIQGIIGANRNTVHVNEPATVNNNIAIYAVSGQRDNVARSYITNSTLLHLQAKH